MTDSPFGIRLACLDMAMNYHNNHGNCLPHHRAEQGILMMAAKFYNFINGDFTEIPELRDQIKLIDKPSANLSKKTVSFVPSGSAMTVSIDLVDTDKAISDLNALIDEIKAKKDVDDVKRLAGIYHTGSEKKKTKTFEELLEEDNGTTEEITHLPESLLEFVEPLIKDRSEEERLSFRTALTDIHVVVKSGVGVLVGDYNISASAYLAWFSTHFYGKVGILAKDMTDRAIIEATLKSLPVLKEQVPLFKDAPKGQFGCLLIKKDRESFQFIRH